MHPFSSVPVLRLLIPFCIGIVLQIFFPVDRIALIYTCIFFAGMAIAFTYVKKILQKYKYRWVYGICMTFFMLTYAMLSVNFYTESSRPKYFGNTIDHAQGYALRITEPYHEKEKSLKATATVEAIKVDDSWQPVTGNIIMYLEKCPDAYKLNYGDIIYTNVKPQAVKEPQNPGSFNYKRFLSFHGIYHQLYLKDSTWTKTYQYWTNPLWDVAYNLKGELVKEIKKQIVTDNEVAVCSALLIGYEDYLDQELIDAYSSSGALHVLSVSGLHVGIIFIVLQWLLGWMDKRTISRAFKNILIILIIWFYALLAGLAPSILRSALMITMIIIGKWMKRDSYMLNTTLWSAFILLHFNPFMLTEVGFQLSYLAVFGIVYLHQRLVQLWIAPNTLLQKIWELTAVSLCAQLMTFPLGLLYFNQFPNLFLISNLLVIPISSLLMIVSIGATVFMWWPAAAFYLWKISYALAWLMNKIVLIVDKIPYALIKGIWISIGQTWVIYLIIAMSLWFLLYKQKLALFLFFGFMSLFIIWLIVDEYAISQQKKLIVYDISKTTAIDIITGRDHVFITTDSLINDKSKIRFNIQRMWFELGIQKTIHVKFMQKPDSINVTQNDFGQLEKTFLNAVKVKEQFVQAGNKLIFIPIDWLPKKNANKKVKVDYVIITSRFTNKLSKLEEVVDADKIILDGSANTKHLLREPLQYTEKYFNVKEKGAFLCDM